MGTASDGAWWVGGPWPTNWRELEWWAKALHRTEGATNCRREDPDLDHYLRGNHWSTPDSGDPPSLVRRNASVTARGGDRSGLGLTAYYGVRWQVRAAVAKRNGSANQGS